MRITVFTPTYNRGYIIERLYRSLVNQSYKSFEWLIVDDGSIDDTEKLVQSFIMEERIRILYYKVKNGGKQRAINYALDKANGDLFLTIDSDDYLVSDALSKIDQWEKSLENKHLYCGVGGNLGTETNLDINPRFSSEYIDSTLLSRHTYMENGESVLQGERAYAFYTEVHRRYLYPVYEEETFIKEEVTWNRMANDGYLMRFYNDTICIYEYQSDGLSFQGSQLFIDNPKGHFLWAYEKNRFLGVGIQTRVLTVISFCIDYCPYYSDKKIAEITYLPVTLIKMIRLILKSRKLWRRV